MTLTELMVVVIIVGVLSAVAIPTLRSDPVPGAARQIAAVLQEARRRAMSRGPIREDVVAATGIRHRVNLEIDDGGPSPAIRLWELVEDPLPANTASWVLIEEQILSRDVDLYGVKTTAEAVSGNALPAPLSGAKVERRYYPNGTCDAMTLYLSDADGPDKSPYRIYVYPLSAVPTVARDW